MSFVECLSLGKNCGKSISDLKDSIGTANKDPNYLRRLQGKKIDGGIILVNESGGEISNVDMSVIENIKITAASNSINEKMLKKLNKF